MDSLVGHTLHDKYRIGEPIGRGGMGSVYKAEHLGTGRPVAVKTILPQFLTDAGLVERFRREARAAGSLRHPNIVDVTDFGIATLEGQDVAYLVMEYLEGSTLRALLEKAGALPLEIVVEIVEQVAIALDAAHRLGVVHRDLKPDNIWLVPDPRGGYVVRILDFGIAKLREPESAVQPDSTSAVAPARPAPRPHATAPASSMQDAPTAAGVPPFTAGDVEETRVTNLGPLTELGATLGTPAYMSPEQCRGEHVDGRSDIYSLGIVAWQALAGRHPFAGTLEDVRQKQIGEAPPRVDEVNPGIPRQVGEAIAVALAKSPDGRYASAGAMAGSIRVASEGPATILQRSLVLYLGRFDAFIRLSLRAATPVLAVLAVEVIGLTLAWLFLGTPAGGQATSPGRIAVLARVGALLLVNLFLWLTVTVTHHIVFASVVDRLRSQPLHRIELDTVFSDIKHWVGLDPSASWTRTMLRLVRCYLGIELNAPPGQGDLAAQIAFHEGSNTGKIYERCLTLSRATTRSYTWLRVFILGGMVLPLIVEGSLMFSLGVLFGLQPTQAAALTRGAIALLIPVNAIFINPWTSPALAVLYYRARQALGESVGLSAVMPSRL